MLIQGNCVVRVLGETALTLEARAGESFLVRRLYCEPHDDDDYLTLRVDRKTVAVWRANSKGGNQIGHQKADTYPLNLTEYLEDKGVNIAVPVAEGQTLSIDGLNAATELVIVYDTYSAGDILATMPNGSDAKEYIFMQYMESSKTASSSGDMILDVSLSPAEFPDFPCGKVVPARHTIEMLGLVGNPYAQGFSSSVSRTTFVKLVKDRETLFDRDRAGIVFRGQASGGHRDSYQTDFSLIGGCHDGSEESGKADIGFPFMFTPPLVFVPGEELLVYVTQEQLGSETLEGTYLDIAAILHVKVE